MARTRSAASIKAKITKLQEQLQSARQREAERFATLAIKAGLDEVEVSDDDLLAAFKEIAGKFRPPAEDSKPAT